MNIQVTRAALDQEPVLANLLELYCHDFSEMIELNLGKDGRFGYPNLPLYWTDPNRVPLLVTVDGNLAGFVLLCRGSVISGDPQVWDVAEFFIVRGCRRCGTGTAVAHKVWRMFPGRWEVRVMKSNHAALEFWKRAVSAFTGNAAQPALVEKAGKKYHVFSFISGAD